MCGLITLALFDDEMWFYNEVCGSRGSGATLNSHEFIAES